MNYRIIFAVNNQETEKQLRLSGLKEFFGVYKGQGDVSFMDICDDEESMLKILRLAQKHNQESVLVLDESNCGELLFLATGERIKLGQWQKVSSASNLDAYSIDQNGTIWSCQ